MLRLVLNPGLPAGQISQRQLRALPKIKLKYKLLWNITLIAQKPDDACLLHFGLYHASYRMSFLFIRSLFNLACYYYKMNKQQLSKTLLAKPTICFSFSFFFLLTVIADFQSYVCQAWINQKFRWHAGWWARHKTIILNLASDQLAFNIYLNMWWWKH